MRRSLHTLAIIPLVLLTGLLISACSPGGLFSGDLMWTPHREVASQPDQSGDAARALVGGLAAREVTLTEAQATHLLRRLWGDTPEDERAIRDMRVLFDPDLVSVKVLLRQGVVPGIPSDTALNLAGRLATVDGRLRFEVERAGVGVIPLAPQAVLDLINNAMAALLQDQAIRAADRVVLEQGQIVIYLE